MRYLLVIMCFLLLTTAVPVEASTSRIQRITLRIQKLKAQRKATSDPALRSKLTTKIQRLKKRRKSLRLKQSKSASSDPAGTTTSIGNILTSITSQFSSPMSRSSFSKFKPKLSGGFGLTNISLNGSSSFTSFDDSNIGSSGHTEEYTLSLSGDLTEKDRLSFNITSSRFSTGGEDNILATTQGFSAAWVHSLNENYGLGAFGLVNSVDIEDINGNSYSYGYGLLFTSFHSFEHFELSTATALAHSDYETGYDQLFMTSVTLSKSWTDHLNSYVTLSFTDSLKSDPEGDPTYGSWTVGGDYLVTENLSVGLAFQRTEFLNNFSDNTLMVNVGWLF